MNEQTLAINDFPIRVSFRDGSVHVLNDRSLWQSMDGHPRQAADELAKQLKAIYLEEKGQELKISDRSLAIELLGHLYYEYYVLLICRFLPGKYAERYRLKLLGPTLSFDCGERNRDSNRWIWDLLAPLYPAFICLLPKRILAKGLKGD